LDCVGPRQLLGRGGRAATTAATTAASTTATAATSNVNFGQWR
jgi:hypothetical protein